MAVTDIELDVELLKKEVSDMKEIHGRLDTAITKITDVSNCINRMLAVHEEKISQQEEVQIRDAQTFANDVKELHSRITTSQKEITELMRKQHYEFESEIRRLREDVTNRVGVLERWKYLIIGGSIVVGFVINAYMRYVM
jgi:peptidoglycan hydrolase CwlO-like protein|tara:strand:+ start:34 stop:453 length:420 start_codon:yes stop_codon:yes gene_type:complete